MIQLEIVQEELAVLVQFHSKLEYYFVCVTLSNVNRFSKNKTKLNKEIYDGKKKGNMYLKKCLFKKQQNSFSETMKYI